ncbi:cation channel sperm-associated protein 2-like isoform X10 [Haliotis rubra]|uniref:cation channel sperm-associated protein 2-like isoform X10 n=1 Tax=Haliotis rubra TaxID=36100 RepID=UPI001EE5A1E5|nr:cation channel sperm-associated protein 2-like isoform X10 [Haliotis rubra]
MGTRYKCSRINYTHHKQILPCLYISPRNILNRIVRKCLFFSYFPSSESSQSTEEEDDDDDNDSDDDEESPSEESESAEENGNKEEESSSESSPSHRNRQKKMRANKRYLNRGLNTSETSLYQEDQTLI